MNAMNPQHENAQTVTSMTMIQALRSAMDIMLERDDDVVVFGQDVGYFGGVFRCTEGLQKKYGTSRVFDAPISESGIIGAAVGMGAYGLRPVVEIQFADYVYPASDQLDLRGGAPALSLGRRLHRADDRTHALWRRHLRRQTHSQSPEAMFTQVCGLRTVMPSNPYDAKGLLIACIENDDPVIFLEPKRLYNGPFDGHHDRPVTPWSKHPASQVPDGYYQGAAGQGGDRPPRRGADRADLRHHGLRGPGRGRRDRPGRRDHRPAQPLARWTWETIVASVKKTGRCVIAHEATRTCGFGAELMSLVQEHCFHHLEAPIERVTGWDTPTRMPRSGRISPAPRVGAAFKRVMEV